MRNQLTLYGDDARRFSDLRERVGEARPGSTPCNAELVRILMDEFEANGGASSL
ncbi:MAG: hypothetical protein ACI8XM_000237 [Haloarculaceae archaeon]|jgi:hypothetical protein